MKFSRVAYRPDASFDLTPMIDVILLLIVFFMLSSQFSRTEQLQVELPREEGDEAAGEERPSELILDLTRNGGLFVRSRPVELSELPRILGVTEAELGGVKPEVIVRADRLGRAEHLNRLATELARHGISGWKLATVPGSGGSGAEAPTEGANVTSGSGGEP